MEDISSEKEPKFKFHKSSIKKNRYFDDNVQDHEVVKVKLKRKGQQKFEGEIIKVEENKPRVFQPNYRQRNRRNVVPGQKNPKIPKEKLEKYSRGEGVETTGVKTQFFKEKQMRQEIYIEYATEQAARAELLLTEQQGFIEPDEEELTADYRQADIVKNVDILSASKHFKLNLDFGPYTMRYTKNGRHLLLGGRRGHVAAFDWITKKLICEMNVMEEVADVSWLHVNTMFACAQKNWVFVYDHQGTELHCIKRMYRVNRMEFLPYHFLLATASSEGYACWVDISIGELIGNFNTQMGDIRLMRHNPANGVLCTGGGKGVVSMWSPKVHQPLATVLCHGTPMTALTVDSKGKYMVTAGVDRKVKVWDVRSLKGPMTQYLLRLPANQLEVSQRGVLAITEGGYLEMYSNLLERGKDKRPYLRHHCGSFVHGMRFCPYEDVLGVATAEGFESLLVPGAGEPNYDALEDNPLQTKAQRREHEIHALLEKIPPELITLDPTQIAGVDAPTLQEKVDAKHALFHVKPPQIDFKSRHKMKGRGGSVKAARNKQIVKNANRKEFIAELRKAKNEVIKQHKVESSDYVPLEVDSKPSVLDRFKPKKKKT